MDQKLKRMDNESQDQYFYRICKMKDVLGFTWSQMADVFNSEFENNCTESKYRKDWAAFERIFNANEDKIIGDNEYLDEIRSAKRELEKERKKIQAEKIEYNRGLTHEGRYELFYENIRKSIEALPQPEIVVGKSDYLAEHNEEYVLCIADLQLGAKFKLINNEYSIQICQDRFNKLLDMMVEYVQFNNIYKVNVIELGDTVQGLLRLTDLKLNETSVVEATVSASRMIANFLNQLSAYCDIEYYHTPTSNHSQNRNLGSKASELAFEDMEFIIGNYIYDLLIDNDRVNVHLNNGYDYIYVPIFDFNVLSMHGHTIKNLNTALRDLSSTHRKLIDYIFIGHWHTGKVIPGNEQDSHDTEVLMCPSFQGTDPYALNKLGLSSKAACKLFIFDKKYGCVGTEKFILN